MEQIDWSKAPEWADRVVRSPIRLKLFWANNNERRALDDSRFGADSQHVRDNWEVVERRPKHFPARPPETVNCRCVPAPVARTIEQRIASLRALDKQVEETRAELTRDLEALGLTWRVRDEPEQPNITDWRDLRVGDVIECIEPWGGYISHGDIGTITRTSNDGVISDFASQNGYKYEAKHFGIKFRFIRRP